MFLYFFINVFILFLLKYAYYIMGANLIIISIKFKLQLFSFNLRLYLHSHFLEN